jgi:hypothetical protein
MNERTRNVVWRAVWRAAGHRVTLVCTGITAGTGVVFQSGTLFVLASFGWAVSFAVNLTRGHLWQEAVAGQDLKSIELPPESSLQEPVAKHFLARLASTRLERLALLRDLPPQGSPPTRGITARTVELEQAAVTLIRSLDRMTGYLGTRTIASVRAELLRLQQLAQSPDVRAAARLEAERACAMVQGRLTAIDQIESCKVLVTARLEAIVATLEALPSRLARAEAAQSSLRVLQDDAPLDGLRDELENLDVAARAAIEAEGGREEEARPVPGPLVLPPAPVVVG